MTIISEYGELASSPGFEELDAAIDFCISQAEHEKVMAEDSRLYPDIFADMYHVNQSGLALDQNHTIHTKIAGWLQELKVRKVLDKRRQNENLD